MLNEANGGKYLAVNISAVGIITFFLILYRERWSRQYALFEDSKAIYSFARMKLVTAAEYNQDGSDKIIVVINLLAANRWREIRWKKRIVC